MLLSLKPHVIYLFWPFLLLWIVQTRRWKVLIGMSGALFCLLSVSSLIHPGIYSHYLRGLLSEYGPKAWETPTLYVVLIKLFPNYGSALQYLPMLCGLSVGLLLWRKWQEDFRWDNVSIWLTLISALTAPYLWPGDLVVLLPIALLVLQRYRQREPFYQYLALALVLMQIVMVLQMCFAKSYFVMVWVASAVGLVWICSERTMSTKECAP
jgi:hypothetical protein